MRFGAVPSRFGAGGDDHRLRLELEIAGDIAGALVAALDGARLQDVAAHAVDGPTGAG